MHFRFGAYEDRQHSKGKTGLSATKGVIRPTLYYGSDFNSLECKGNYSATSNNVKLVLWPSMDGLLLYSEEWPGWGPQPAQATPRCTKCNNPPIDGQCTNHRYTV